MILILIGPPGAGKGTQAERLVKDFGFVKLSTGDILRKHIQEKTEIGLSVSGIISRGGYVSDELLLGVVEFELKRFRDKNIILDGYPRTMKQADDLSNLENVDLVIHIDVDDELIKDRILGRLTCAQCNAVFHKLDNPPKVDGICDLCGATLKNRVDDTEEKLSMRLSLYKQETEPVLEYYRKKMVCKRIHGGNDVDQVYASINALVANFLSPKNI